MSLLNLSNFKFDNAVANPLLVSRTHPVFPDSFLGGSASPAEFCVCQRGLLRIFGGPRRYPSLYQLSNLSTRHNLSKFPAKRQRSTRSRLLYTYYVVLLAHGSLRTRDLMQRVRSTAIFSGARCTLSYFSPPTVKLWLSIRHESQPTCAQQLQSILAMSLQTVFLSGCVSRATYVHSQ